MIGYFPSPYQDELLSSICSRYADHMGFPDERSVLRSLFSSSRHTIGLLFTSGLDRLVANLAIGSGQSADALIDRHSLLPLFTPFTPPAQMEVRRGALRGDDRKGIARRLGVTAWVRAERHLRYCPACVAVERRRQGECYWHRTHQVPGVLVCPKHSLHLLDSDIRVVGHLNFRALPSAERTIGPCTGGHLSGRASRGGRALLQLAQDVAWILDAGILTYDEVELRRRYHTACVQRGWAPRYSDQLSRAKLKAAFRRYYSPQIRALLDRELGEPPGEGWLDHFLRHPGAAYAPLRHLLIIQVLGYTAEAFLRMRPTDDDPIADAFGAGPWPCLNPACDHYGERRIMACRVRIRRDGRDGPYSIGTFTCECGYAYVRRGPDRTEQDQWRVDRVARYGPTWEASLCTAWDNPDLTLAEAARRLAVAPDTLKTHARRLGLADSVERGPDIEQPGDAVRLGQTTLNLGDGKPAQIPQLEVRRTEVLRILPEGPRINHATVDRKAWRAFRTLRAEDPEWLKRKVPRGLDRQTNWDARDRQFATEVRAAADALRARDGCPWRITRRSLSLHLGKSLPHPSERARYPRTFAAVDEVIESRVDVALRRILWAAEQCGGHGVAATRYGLRTLAHVGADVVAAYPQVQDAMDQALIRLSPSSAR